MHDLTTGNINIDRSGCLLCGAPTRGATNY